MNIIIDHLRTGRDSYLIRLSKQFTKEHMGISVVSVQELYEGKSTRTDEKEKYLLATISRLPIHRSIWSL